MPPVSTDVRRELSSLLEGPVLSDDRSLDLYSRAACLYAVTPAAAARARHAEDVAAAVAFAARHGLGVTCRGAGSSVAGGALGEDLVLDLGDLQGIELEGEVVHAGVGVTRNELEAFLAEQGLSFPVDPSSGAWCTIGGMVMTNAAGPHSLAYGATRHRLVGLEGVDAEGHRVRFPSRGEEPAATYERDVARLLEEAAEDLEAERPRTPKCSSGYWLWDLASEEGRADLLPLLCGSEGTLVVATRVSLRVEPRPPARRTALLAPSSLEAGVDALLALGDHDLSALEMLDDAVLALLRENPGPGDALLPREPGAILLWADADAEEDGRAREILEAALEATGSVPSRVLEDRSEAEALAELRRRVSPLLKEAAGAGRRPARFVEDGCVPPKRLGEYVRGLRGILEEAGFGPAPTFGHAGQGHLHCNPSLDLSEEADRDRLAELVAAHAALVTGLGGVPSGEHGDGRLRAATLAGVFPRCWKWMRSVKALFDPRGNLNPRAKVPAAKGAVPSPREGLDPRMEALRMDGVEQRRRFLEGVGAA